MYGISGTGHMTKLRVGGAGLSYRLPNPQALVHETRTS